MKFASIISIVDMSWNVNDKLDAAAFAAESDDACEVDNDAAIPLASVVEINWVM